MQLHTQSDASPLTQEQAVLDPPDRAKVPDALPGHHVTIRPRGRWEGPDFAELWANRELLAFLTWRDIKVRYQQTVLGAAWAIIQPLFTMLIFTLFFGRLAKLPSDGIPYPIFAYAGLLPWTFFSNAVTNTGNSLIGSSQLISKVYFPRMLIPGAAVGAGIVDFLIAFSILGVLMVVYRISPTWNLLMLPILTLLTALLALGVGLWMSALNVKYRDVRYALPFLVQLWMFATPIIYPSSMVPERWRWVLQLNPLTGIIEGFRDALFGRAFDWRALGVAAAVTAVILVFSTFSFRRMEREFADVI
jgi:lipopolysaccharide transport system permease protein